MEFKGVHPWDETGGNGEGVQASPFIVTLDDASINTIEGNMAELVTGPPSIDLGAGRIVTRQIDGGPVDIPSPGAAVCHIGRINPAGIGGIYPGDYLPIRGTGPSLWQGDRAQPHFRGPGYSGGRDCRRPVEKRNYPHRWDKWPGRHGRGSLS